VKDPPAAAELAHADQDGALMASLPNELSTPNDDLIREALRNRGARYVWGGASRGAFDCSGECRKGDKRKRKKKLLRKVKSMIKLKMPLQLPLKS